jgi:hypothetical protein
MPSTSKRRLSSFLAAIGRTGARSYRSIETKVYETYVNLSASSTEDGVVYYSAGPGAVQRILFIPEISVGSSAVDFWTVSLINKGTDGLGATVLGTFTTNGSALVAYDAKVFYNPAVELQLANDTVLAMSAVKNNAPANLQGKLIVEYIPTMDD